MKLPCPRTRKTTILYINHLIVISSPTENLCYRLGRMIARFLGHYHRMNIKEIEREFANRLLFECARSIRCPVPVILEDFITQTWHRL
jgi:hypothetical protein